MCRKAILLLAAGAAIVAVVLAVRVFIEHFETNLMEHKKGRTTIGVVIDKRYVRFGTDQTEYQNDEGRTVHLDDWRRKSGEFRIFYKIENFDQMPETHRSSVMATEEERSKRFGARFRIVDQKTFDQTKIGQFVNVTYRWADDSNIEVISFDPNSQKSENTKRREEKDKPN